MEENPINAQQLLDRLELLSTKQNEFATEIRKLRTEVYSWQSFQRSKTEPPTEVLDDVSAEVKAPPKAKADYVFKEQPLEKKERIPVEKTFLEKKIAEKISSSTFDFKNVLDIEKFVGENLINKIGIIITIIGVAIGVRYTIEHDLISPLTRIILGYLSGIALLAFGIKSKKNYKAFSAVLVSGAIAIMYFISYSGYAFYGLMPQTVAFGLMVIFTIFTVLASLNYNQQVIALIGLVGAYAIPFLLSNDSGNVTVLFSYIAIINVGILVIAVKKSWRPVYYAAFVLTWVMFMQWYIGGNGWDEFKLAGTFLTVFFFTFYLTFLAYNLLQDEKFKVPDVLVLFLNSFLFYGVGYSLLNQYPQGRELLGLFTLGNALIHFVVSVTVFRQKFSNKNLFYFVAGLVLLFVTLAIPVELDGRWVTLLWAFEASLLFWIGRSKGVRMYELIAYPLMLLALFSIFQDWSQVYGRYSRWNLEARLTPLLNINFLSSLLFIAAFGFIYFFSRKDEYPSALQNKDGLGKLISYGLPIVILFLIYQAFFVELHNYWDQLLVDSSLLVQPEGGSVSSINRNNDLLKFQSVWTVNYTLFFVSLLGLLNFKFFKTRQFSLVNMGLLLLSIFLFLTAGLFELSELRESYIDPKMPLYFKPGMFHLGIRYVSIGFFALALFVLCKYFRMDLVPQELKYLFDIILHVSVLWIASSELLHWMDLTISADSYKLGLSILWCVYALLIIAYGIWKSRKHLRIGGIVLFGLTIAKVFFYDIEQLNTISKTIVMVSLGVFLLITSFLYNKYTSQISDE